MKESRQILTAILNIIRFSQVRLSCCLRCSMRPGLRSALESQQREYHSIALDAQSLACRRGWEIRDTDPFSLFLLRCAMRLQLRRITPDDRIAGILIRRNTDSLIRLSQNLHHVCTKDEALLLLVQKLLDCEHASIRQLQRFL